MVLRLKLLGSGIAGDPYRVSLPTYNLIHGNVTGGYALVSIPDDVLGLTDADLADESVELTTEGKFYPVLSVALIDKVHAHLDERYNEHRGKFRIELA
jgi:hypothetical protein